MSTTFKANYNIKFHLCFAYIAIGQRRWNHWTATKIKLILIIVTCLFKKDGEKSSITHLCNVFESSQTAFRMLILLMVALCERARAFASLCTLFLRFYYPFFESCIYSCSYLCEPNWIEKERKKEITNKLIETHICDMVYVVVAFFSPIFVWLLWFSSF